MDGKGRHKELKASQGGPAAAGHKFEQRGQLLGIKALHHLQSPLVVYAEANRMH